MMLALAFGNGLLLIGVLAAAIPFLLHMLSSVRAQEVLFPTLRFLQLSMEKTARRRKIQQWLLLVLRAALLGLLAIGVAEPITAASQGYLGGQSSAAVIVLDNSYSMEARLSAGNRFAQAKSEALALLGGQGRPGMAALLTTASPSPVPSLTGSLESLREQVASARIGHGQAVLAGRVRQAIDLLQHERSAPQKSIYLLSDLQRSSFEELLSMEGLDQARDIHWFVINTAQKAVDNVGIGDLQIQGQAVVGQTLALTARLVNSSGAIRKVQVSLQVNGSEVGEPIIKALQPVGSEGSSDTVRFYHTFGEEGPVEGQVVITPQDDLAQDNVRRFALEIAPKVKAVIVRPPSDAQEPVAMDGAGSIRVALDPFDQASRSWSIAPEVIEAAGLNAASLHGADIVFVCEVPSLTPAQAKALIDFTRAGGTTVLVLGPSTQAETYNKLFLDDLPRGQALLPARIGPAVGEVGPSAAATAVTWMDLSDPLLEGLYENPADCPTMLVQRYYRLGKVEPPARAIMRLASGDTLLAGTPVGRGRALLLATTGSPRWSNLPSAAGGVFVPMLVRMTLQAAHQDEAQGMYLPGTQVTVCLGAAPQTSTTPPERIELALNAPSESGQTTARTVQAALDQARGYVATIKDTSLPGMYHWRMSASGDLKLPRRSGTLAVNPLGKECELDAMSPEQFRGGLLRHGLEHVYVADTLDGATAQALAAAKGHNWWDLVLAVVIVLLVAEALVANRRRLTEDAIPPHLSTGFST